jgi:3-methylfumaryl-CoA hydratase
MSQDWSRLQDWVGRTEAREDVVAADRVKALAATFDLDTSPRPGEPLPPGWHWMFFNTSSAALARDIGADGHPRLGGFLPDTGLPRRMWAGGRLRYSDKAVKVGEAIRRVSEIAKVEVKQGRSGTLVFVLVKHRIEGAGGGTIEEEHDIVYRDAPVPGAPTATPPAAPTGAAWTQAIRPDPVLLFRYSALTFNGHRIHYDQPYVTRVEGYPGLIVHGPLISTLLLELLRHKTPGRRLDHYSFRAVSPLFDTAGFSVNGIPDADGRSAKLWAAGPQGQLAMEATAVIA